MSINNLFRYTFVAFLISVLPTLSTYSQEPALLAKNIEASVTNINPSYINSLFHYKTFKNTIIVREKRFREFNDKFNNEVLSNLDPGSLIQAQISPSSTYTCINTYSRNNKYILVFRVNSETGLDYHEYHLSKIENEYRIVDIYMYYEDILLSQKIREVYNIVAHATHPDFFSSEVLKSSMLKLKSEEKLIKSYSEGKYKKTLKQYNKLDTEIQSERNIMLYALKASSYLSSDDMHSVLNKFTPETYSNGLNLIVLEGLYTQEEYHNTLEYIDKVDESVETDPYLNFLRASVYKALGETDKAEWFLNKLMQDLPNEQSIYFSLLELYLENGRYADASLVLTDLSNNFGFYKEELAPLLSIYPKYLDSEECVTWLEN